MTRQLTSVVIASDDDQTSILQTLDGGVPPVTGHLQVPSDVRSRVLPISGLSPLQVFTGIIGTGVEHTDSGTSVRVRVSTITVYGDSSYRRVQKMVRIDRMKKRRQVVND
jgi:hypothetical protein